MKVIVSLSGGMDSATVLGLAVAKEHEVLTVGFCYGSKHNPWENLAAENLARHYHVPFKLIDLSVVFAGFPSHLMQEGGPIPEGHYEDESMSLTVVPARNIIFTSILTGYAWAHNAEQVHLGIHAGDHAIYPDCRPEFYNAMKEAVERGTDQRVSLCAPFLHDNKVGIITTGMKLGVPYELTRTCYTSDETACGKCGSCQERLEAFAANGITDPIRYAN